MTDANSASETVFCVPWVVFASGQSLREEYNTTASTGIGAALEQEVSALCREFHNSIGVQEVPEKPPVVLFWKARQSSHWIVTQVLRAPAQPGRRIAYEYFSLALTEADLNQLGGNPLRAIELVNTENLRENCAAGLREPVCVPIAESHTANIATESDTPSQFSQGGAWPATAENREAMLAYLEKGVAAPTFATWWPGASPPRPGVFDITLRSDAMRAARPHEILAVATELNHSLSRSLPAPPSYDTVAGRCYRALLHGADEVQAMLGEAYLPAALEESPHRWMTRPQKLAGLCQKIADDLPDYAARLPASFSAEMAGLCTELVGRYSDLARELQKLRHPNMLHQSRSAAATGAATDAAKYQVDGTQGASRKGTQIAVVIASLLALCLLGFGVRTWLGESNAKLHPATAASKKRADVAVLSSSEEDRRDQQAIALMRARAEREVFPVARALAAKRTHAGKGLSNDAMQSTVVDAVAQAMSQTPHPQITPSQKRLLFRMATAPIRAKAMDGVRAGVRQGRRIKPVRR